MVIYSFEQGVPESFTSDVGSQLSISDRHYKDGNHSLQWSYLERSELKISQFIGYRSFQEGARDQARDSFVMWLYNPVATEGQLSFEFGRGGQSVDCSFSFGLNFVGWRTAWVAYERDMEGTPHPDMDTLTLRIPNNVIPGTLFIDQMMLNTKIDPRFHTRDIQVPFVNLHADVSANAHWLSLYTFEQLKATQTLPNSITQERKEAHVLMNERYEALYYKPSSVSAEELDDLRQRFAELGIEESEGCLIGRPVELFYDHYPNEIKEELKELSSGISLSKTTQLLMDIAISYKSSVDFPWQAEMKTMFLTILDHLDDQGWTYGSSQGTVHHFGYNFKHFYPAVFLMRNVLVEAEKLERTQRTMRWYSGAGRIHTMLSEVEGNIDIYNTTLHGILASILICDDSPDKIRELEAFRDWLGQSMLPAPGLRAAYKIDGSAYHHVNHYPAYAVGGFQGITPVMFVLSGTPYRVGILAHETIRKALLAMRLYSNKREWLISLSARHPTGKWALDIEPYAWLARCQLPASLSEFDTEMAAAYLRLLEPGEDTEAARDFRAAGIKAEPDPNGHWTMNYAALSIHRRDGWLAGMRGHSRYLWANETYVNANLYGRYISHGHLQIMSKGEPINNEASGYHHDGWDWNRWPGTTTIHKPIADIRSNVCNVDTFSGFEEMLLSDETFAGGLHLEGRNGMFAMKLHEHPKYEGSHRARKSAFFFDELIVCIGTGIENDNAVQMTETTLFQQHLPNPYDPTWLNESDPIHEFPYTSKKELDKPAWLLDNKGNFYFIPPGQTLALSRTTQYSKHQATGVDTQGNFAAAWLEHGTSPKNGRYEYAIQVGTDVEQAKELCERMQQSESSAYAVLCQKFAAHVVKHKASNTTAYALFEANERLQIGHVLEVDTPCLVMIRESSESLMISIVDPDLRLYEGIEADQYDSTGVQKEISVYSRKWVHAKSIPHPLQLTLIGQWKEQTAKEGVRVIIENKDMTIVEIISIEAMPREFVMIPSE